MFVEVKTDHVDDKGVIHIDGFKDFDENAEGIGIGYIIHGEVYWRDAEYQFDPLVKAIVADVLAEQKPFVLDTIDYPKLKAQKQKLIYVTDDSDLTQETRDELQGIINLLDSIQDFVVDVMGKPESEVFKLTDS